MRFLVKSLGGKLIAGAALTLLLCMLLFSVSAWALLKYFSEHEATSDAKAHLELIKKAYQAQETTLVNQLTQEVRKPKFSAAVSQASASPAHNQLPQILTSTLARYGLSTLEILSADRKLMAHVPDDQVFGSSIPVGTNPLVDCGLQVKP